MSSNLFIFYFWETQLMNFWSKFIFVGGAMKYLYIIKKYVSIIYNYF
jgi:hypothetical protein